ncbi:hypothetical protein M422DRAFT_31332 [Sphaerobolus stellatus SS14]|uniref:Uncharacterized protein n=1 Tax=Sphaerobolus stellatus (strain SS14) TaxID=990650 RepID=A0A0C9VUY7_SPHS4|nr:hypothetical protein M422DRAFT_31332 [Sphaerobolus stellatus SS14]
MTTLVGSLFVREYISGIVLILQRLGSEELESFVCQSQNIILSLIKSFLFATILSKQAHRMINIDS